MGEIFKFSEISAVTVFYVMRIWNLLKVLFYVSKTIIRDNKRRSFYNETIPFPRPLTRAPPSLPTPHNIIIVTRILASFLTNNNQLFIEKLKNVVDFRILDIFSKK